MVRRSWWSVLVPRSLLSRMLLLLLLAILLSQTILTGIWMQQIQKRELEGMLSTTRNLALSASSTVNFFKSLPLQYRHIALDQLRNMGGTRFFVSLNEQEILINPIPDSERKTLVLREISKILGTKLSDTMAIKVDFSHPEDLHVFNNDTLLADLPSSWARYTLSLEPINPPVLVIQIEIKEGEWLYLAALLPAPYMTLDDTVMPANQVRFIALMTVFLCFFTFMLVRWQTRPLRRLAKAAANLGKDIDQPSLREEGASEIVAATRAFNIMQHRIRRYIDDRERLFSSISHDLKTPITRLRLRVELLDDETQITKFNKDLDELEMMVKGALQTVKDTDIHENIEQIDVNGMLNQLAESLNLREERLMIEGSCKHPYRGKPLALKRCIANLVDNGIKYGKRVRIIIFDDDEVLILFMLDEGPGIADDQLDRIFEPYYRLDTEQPGNGLGLGIARSIAHAHGGDLVLENRPTGGLQATLSLPRQ
ncbi:Signal transduction histidine kinase [Aeromonas sp. RU39B]|jgi:signal transduction histidine kinase|uniref:ATP-binding protein n=1 Tax=Aeromonas sp. RU39B TaxID=1907416 RepID=UPI00095658B3|nr:ATP-binding protein [Aeromonas sp. RU39B]SIR17744.1 Signal transduction histidine kinase [Aeromonas sp. RU39B]